MLKILDPEGVQLRSRHRLQRRKYKTAGPNHIWHIDGYDKLKPFGFCIHGAIDGYSRRIMWIEVGSTNNDPFVIAQYYLDCVRQVGGIPKIIRADCGTENVNGLFYNDFFTIRIKAFYLENRHLINASRPGGVCLSGEVWLGGLIFLKI